MKQIFIAVMAMGLAGCSGHVVTYMSADKACDKETGICKGVPFFLSEPQIEERTLTYIPGKDGSPARTSDGEGDKECKPVTLEKVVNREAKDVSYISYRPGLFEYADFSVDLKDSGTLSKVGVNPTSGFKEGAEAVSTLATTFRGRSRSRAESLPDCTE